MAQALIKAARASLEMGQSARARKDLQHILARYSATAVAEEAKKMLADIAD